ncbi:MAG: hypothetical protein AAF658_15260, partial [Myxococcota bacterium]
MAMKPTNPQIPSLQQFMARMTGRTLDLDAAQDSSALSGVALHLADGDGNQVLEGRSEFARAYQLLAQSEDAAARFDAAFKLSSQQMMREVMPRSDQAAVLAGDYVREVAAQHRRLVSERGYGTHFGCESRFGSLPGTEKIARLEEMTLTDAQRVEMPRRTSCIAYAMECVRSYYEARGELERYLEIEKAVVADGSRGTTLAQQLQADGFEVIYYNSELPPPGGVEVHDWSFADAIRDGRPYLDGARDRDDGSTRTLYPDHVIWGFGGNEPEGSSTTSADLDRVPFLVWVREAGSHCGVGRGGEGEGAVSSEVHWTLEPDDPKVIDD